MFYCNSCNRTMLNKSRNRHMKTPLHIKNELEIPFVDQRIQFSLEDVKITDTPTYPDVYRCSYCGNTEKDNFYEYNKTRCKKCKYEREQEIKQKKKNKII